MLDVLPNLHNCTPSVRSKLFLAVLALYVHFGELSHECLLYFGGIVELVFDGNFHFESL